MPDLNLQDDGGSLDNLEGSGDEELRISDSGGEPKRKGSGLTVLIVIILILIIGGGGAYLLNRLGVVQLWGKKPAPQVVQMQQPPGGGQGPAMSADTAQIPMIETPPLGETKKASPSSVKPSTRQAQPRKEMPVTSAGPRLGEMTGEYTVQVSAWRDKGTAEEMVGRLEEAGYPAFIEERPYDNETWYTVRVGRYASRKDAQLAVGNFADELKSNYWIDRIRTR